MIRRATTADLSAIVGLVRELADYERALDHCQLDEAALEAALFGPTPRAGAHVAEEDGTVVAMAVWFRTFSTWTGVHGLWLEDLYVRPDYRRRGIAKALLSTLAALAVAEGAARLDWAVLDWNAPARRFYEALGAEPMDGWIIHRLSGKGLTGRAAEAPEVG